MILVLTILLLKIFNFLICSGCIETLAVSPKYSTKPLVRTIREISFCFLDLCKDKAMNISFFPGINTF